MKSLIPFVVAVIVAAVFGARFKPDAWYVALNKPAWTPPGWLFAPVWTLLYIAIAVAGWLIWRNAPHLSAPLVLWVAQIVFNAIWTWLFFGLHRPGIAFIDIVILFCAIVAFAIAAAPISRLASGLFVPYALWVGFAAALNFSIWQANHA